MLSYMMATYVDVLERLTPTDADDSPIRTVQTAILRLFGSLWPSLKKPHRDALTSQLVGEWHRRFVRDAFVQYFDVEATLGGSRSVTAATQWKAIRSIEILTELRTRATALLQLLTDLAESKQASDAAVVSPQMRADIVAAVEWEALTHSDARDTFDITSNRGKWFVGDDAVPLHTRLRDAMRGADGMWLTNAHIRIARHAIVEEWRKKSGTSTDVHAQVAMRARIRAISEWCMVHVMHASA